MTKYVDHSGKVLLGNSVLSLLLWGLQVRYGGTAVNDWLAAAQYQAQPRRWPWQPKTVRDHINERGGELAALATLQGEALLQIVRKQSQPRKWPWQPKTIRDMLDERSAVVAALAVERSVALAAAVDQRRDELVEAARQQARPRRWPWQPKTIRDQVSERSAKLATLAARRSGELAKLAIANRNALIEEARRQSLPRRWPWQPKTTRDRLDERAARIRSVAADQVDNTRSHVRNAALAGVGLATASAARTAAQAKGAAEQFVPTVQDAASAAAERLRDMAGHTGTGLQERAVATGERVQHFATAVPQTVGAVATAAADSVKGTVEGIGKGIGDTADVAASKVRAAAMVPATAINTTIEEGKRKVRYGINLTRVGALALLIGVAVGLFLAPQSGKELRRQIRDAVIQFLDIVLQPE